MEGVGPMFFKTQSAKSETSIYSIVGTWNPKNPQNRLSTFLARSSSVLPAERFSHSIQSSNSNHQHIKLLINGSRTGFWFKHIHRQKAQRQGSWICAPLRRRTTSAPSVVATHICEAAIFCAASATTLLWIWELLSARSDPVLRVQCASSGPSWVRVGWQQW